MVFVFSFAQLKAAPLAIKAPPFLAGLAFTAFSQVSAEDWAPWKIALFFALLSGLSLPLGAALGIYMTPLKDEDADMETEEEIEAEERRESIVACCLAFGAGALLFAVTVELYGEAMRELEHDGYRNGAVEICVMCGAAMAGALIYTRLNRWLDAYLTREEVVELNVDRENAPLLRQSLVQRRTTSFGTVVLSTTLPIVSEQYDEESKPLDNSFALDDSFRREISPSSALRKSSLAFGPDGPAPSNRPRKLATLAAVDVLTYDKAERSNVKDEGKKSPLLVGMATWLGVFIDGLPEGVLLGFFAAEGHLSMALVVSLFIANFPEAFSSASLLRQARKPIWVIMGLWTSLFVITALLAALAALIFPTTEVPFHWKLIIAFTEGIAGGAMLACIAAVMLPEAYQMQGDTVGLLTVAGFLVSVLVKVFGGVASEYDDDIDKARHVAFLALRPRGH